MREGRADEGAANDPGSWYRPPLPGVEGETGDGARIYRPTPGNDESRELRESGRGGHHPAPRAGCARGGSLPSMPARTAAGGHGQVMTV